jgi:hypothetical protein
MDKKRIFYNYTDFATLQGIGNSWISEVKSYIPISSWITTASVYQIALWAIHINWIPYWAMILFLAIKFYIMIIVNWLGGKLSIKIGLYRARQQYGAKKEHLAPFNVEVIEQLTAIGNKLGVESKFTKL